MSHSKGSGVKPGCLCIIRSPFSDSPNQGKIVTAIRLALPEDFKNMNFLYKGTRDWIIEGRDLYAIENDDSPIRHWRNVGNLSISREKCLIPINDPDQQVDTVTDKELENV